MTEEFNLDILINENNERRMTMEHVETTNMSDAQETVINAVQNRTVEIDNVSVYQYILNHSDKLLNVKLVDIRQFGQLQPNKYLLFISRDESNGSLIMKDNISNMWINNNVTPISIRVENSGIIIDSDDATYYVTKTNIVMATKSNGIFSAIKTFSKAKVPEKVKEAEIQTSSVNDPDIDSVKLFAKNISSGLYKMVKDESDRTEIRTKIDQFMGNTNDIYHLILVTKDLLVPCQI